MTGARADQALAPVRAALLDRARADAEQAVASARQAAEAVLGQARGQAAELLAQAEAAGVADGAATLRTARAQARRLARGAELAAQQEAYRELVERVRAAVRMRAAADLGDRLAARVLAELGPRATVLRAADGGVVGQLDGRRLDLTLTAAADRAVAGLGGEVATLWAP